MLAVRMLDWLYDQCMYQLELPSCLVMLMAREENI